MVKKIKNNFSINWILINEIAISNLPRSDSDILKIKTLGIKNVLQVCHDKETIISEKIKEQFNYYKYSLPDHKFEEKLKKEDIFNCLKILESAAINGSTLVHCFAGKERSPIVCLSYLIYKKKIRFDIALEYIIEANPGTCPIDSHLQIVKDFF